MDNVLRTVVSQYGNSPVILRLIDLANQNLDPKANFNAFYRLIWNVDTAVGIGLDIWGRIVGVGRILNVPSGKYFGFDEATNVSADPFNQSPFYSGGGTTSNFALSDDAFRILIFAKALANISDGSTLSFNRIVTALFPGRGNAYVNDKNDMSMEYIFRFALTPVEAAIIGQSGVMPKPAGVAVNVVYVPGTTGGGSGSGSGSGTGTGTTTGSGIGIGALGLGGISGGGTTGIGPATGGGTGGGTGTPPALIAYTQVAHAPNGAISTSAATPFGVTLATPNSNVLDWTFGSSTPGSTIPDRVTLDRQAYYRDLFGNLADPYSTPGDGTPANWEARYRDYPAYLADGTTRDPRDLHPIYADHLELVARTFGSFSSPWVSATVLSASTGTAVNIATAGLAALTSYAPGFGVAGARITDAPTIASIADATHLTLSSPQTLAAGDVLTFGPAVEMGYLRLPISFKPGMYAEINCQWPTTRWSWPTFWMFSGEQNYGTADRRYGTPSLEVDVYDGFPMDNSTQGISIATGAPIYGADAAYGNPADLFLANGPHYTSEYGSTGGAGVARFDTDATTLTTAGFHRYALDWRDANTLLWIFDGIVVRKRHVTYSAVYSNTSNYDGNPPPAALNGQLVPQFVMLSHQFGCRFNPQDIAALHANTTPIRSPYLIRSVRVWASTSTADAPSITPVPALPAPQVGTALGDLPAVTSATYTLNIDASQPTPVSDRIGGNAVRLTGNAFVDPTQVNGLATIRMQTDGTISVTGPAVGLAQGGGLFTLFLVIQQRNPYGPNPQVLAQFSRATPRSDADHDKITLSMSSFVAGGAVAGFDAKGGNYGAYLQSSAGALATAQTDANTFGRAELVSLTKALGSDGTVTIGQGYAAHVAAPAASGGVPVAAVAGFTELTIGGGRTIDGLLTNGANISFCQAVIVGNAPSTVLSPADLATIQTYLQTKWATGTVAVVTPPAFTRQSSNLPNLLYMFDAAEPTQTAALTAGVPAIQIDASRNVIAVNDPVSNVQAVRGYGALGHVASGGVGNKPFFRGTTASLNTAYDGLVLPVSAAVPLFTAAQEPWSILMVMRQTGPAATAFLQYHSPGGNVTILGVPGAADGILRLEQNNGAAYANEPVSAYSALNQWQVVSFLANGTTLSLYRNGHLVLQTPAGAIGGLPGATQFEMLNNPQADVCFIEVANACPSIAVHNSEVARLGTVYGITVEAVTQGAAANLPPVAIDATLNWLGTPNFPASDALPTEATPSLRNGLVLAAGAVSLAAVTFTPGGTTDTRAKLDAQFYFNPFTGNQNNVIGSDGIEGVTSCFARVRRYAAGSPYDLHTFSAAGLSLNACASMNNTAGGIQGGRVWGGMIRAPTFIVPGTVISVTYQVPTSVRGWVPVWLFSGGQKTPGPGGAPYTGFNTPSALLIPNNNASQYYEYDLNDGFAREGEGVAAGKQLDTSYVNHAAGSFVVQPYDVYTANGPMFRAHPTSGPPFSEILDPTINMATAMHTLVMNWRGDGSHIVDMLLDGHLYKQQYWEYNAANFTDASGATFQIPMHLLLNNQAIPNFLNPPDLQNMTPNDGGAIAGGAWSATFQEVKIIRGNLTAASLAAAKTDAPA